MKLQKKELDKIVEDLAKGLIFADWQIPNDDDIWRVFQVINLMTDEQRKELAQRDIGLIYEYKSQAAYEDEGVPVFISMNTITKKEADYVRKKFPEVYAKLNK